MRNGVRLAVDEINQAGGVMGRALLVIERDDEAKSERGVQIARELIHGNEVAATVGYANTGVALASQKLYQEAKIPVMNNVATGSPITHQFDDQPDNYILRNSAPDSIQAAMIVEEAVTRRGFRKPAILADSTNCGQLGRADLLKALAAKGIQSVADEKFNVKDVDMTTQLLKAKDAGAEALLTYGIGPELAQIANGMAGLGWRVPMIGGVTLAMASYIDNAGPAGEGARMPQTFIQEPTTPKRQSFIIRYLKAFEPKNAHRLPGVGGAGLRLRAFAGRGDEAGRQRRRHESEGGTRESEDAGGGRCHDLPQALLQEQSRRHRGQHARVRRGQGSARRLCVSGRPGEGIGGECQKAARTRRCRAWHGVNGWAARGERRRSGESFAPPENRGPDIRLPRTSA